MEEKREEDHILGAHQGEENYWEVWLIKGKGLEYTHTDKHHDNDLPSKSCDGSFHWALSSSLLLLILSTIDGVTTEGQATLEVRLLFERIFVTRHNALI